jgi:MFS family permease
VSRPAGHPAPAPAGQRPHQSAEPHRRHTFAALQVHNYRLFFIGQTISLVGTWMQSLALSWLAFQLSHSGTTIGLVLAVQFLPVLLIGAYGGLIADRLPKRAVLMATQTAMALLALLLGILSVTHVIALWMVFAIAAVLGIVLAVDSPARQSFVTELVGDERVQNAVSLNSVLTNASRAIGPAVAGGLIASAGVGICFLANAASFGAVLVALFLMRPAELHRTPVVQRRRGQLREGFHYVRANTGLLLPLMMMAVIGTLAYEFPVVLPLLARRSLHGGADTFGVLTSAMGAGAVAGGLVVATVGVTGLFSLTVAALFFGLAILAAAGAPSLPTEMVAMLLVGATSVAFMATGNSTLQLTSDPSFRGRVMALWAVTFQGSTPIGGPIVGFVSQHSSPRAGLILGGLACLVAAALGATALRHTPPAQRGGRVRPALMDQRDYEQAHRG